MSPWNMTDGSAIDIEGETTLLVRGELLNESTKADRTVPYQGETVTTMVMGQCTETDGVTLGAGAHLQ
jgi:hypothetical protein